MRVLYLTKYSRLGASSRLRSYLYFPTFEKQGIDITVKPLFGDVYLHKLYNKQKKHLEVLKSYLKRFWVLFTVFKYDAIVVEKELFPYFPAFFEYLLKAFGIKYIVDYDDAIFHNYDQSNNPLKRLLKNKIRRVMRFSSAVTAGNQYLANYAVNAGANYVEVIPTVVDINKYRAKDNYDAETIIIGWIGSPSTLKYLKLIAPVLDGLCTKYSIKVHIVGGKSGVGLGNNEEVIEWSEDLEAQLIRKFDIGVMPLVDSLWEKGKCGYKIIQYMASAVPVVASPVGVNPDIVINKHTGLLATTDTDWIEALERYIADKQLRERHGKNGRQRVEEHYNKDLTAIKLTDILNLHKKESASIRTSKD